MQMGNLLTGIISLVNHQPKAAAGDTLTPGHFLSHHQHMPNERLLVRTDLSQRGQRHNGNDQQMHWSFGVDVPQDDYLLISLDGSGVQRVSGNVRENRLVGSHVAVTSKLDQSK